VKLPPAFVAAAGELACLLEVSAEKPGTVTPTHRFCNMRYEDFLASAVAIGPVLASANHRPLGASILAAVEATSRWTAANTNLGIILLFAPIARAALTYEDAAPLSAESLRDRLASVLETTTIADAHDTYEAIRLAHPGGLGAVSEQDVSQPEPTVTLRAAMALAQHRDAIASEYTTSFARIFETGLPALRTARDDGLPWDTATTELFLALLAVAPDTLIERKLGRLAAFAVSQGAKKVIAHGGVRTEAGRAALHTFDHELRSDSNTHNPGTTADLTAATLYVALLPGAWRPPGVL
jgi:triphosphoribosyl-dephospho-CoA synthase